MSSAYERHELKCVKMVFMSQSKKSSHGHVEGVGSPSHLNHLWGPVPTHKQRIQPLHKCYLHITPVLLSMICKLECS